MWYIISLVCNLGKEERYPTKSVYETVDNSKCYFIRLEVRLKNLYVNNRTINRRIEPISDGKTPIPPNKKRYIFNTTNIDPPAIGPPVNVPTINTI